MMLFNACVSFISLGLTITGRTTCALLHCCQMVMLCLPCMSLCCKPCEEIVVPVHIFKLNFIHACNSVRAYSSI